LQVQLRVLLKNSVVVQPGIAAKETYSKLLSIWVLAVFDISE